MDWHQNKGRGNHLMSKIRYLTESNIKVCLENIFSELRLIALQTPNEDQTSTVVASVSLAVQSLGTLGAKQDITGVADLFCLYLGPL